MSAEKIDTNKIMTVHWDEVLFKINNLIELEASQFMYGLVFLLKDFSLLNENIYFSRITTANSHFHDVIQRKREFTDTCTNPSTNQQPQAFYN